MLTAPPLAVIEILSPEDRLTRLMTKLADYQQMGVAAILVIDPESGRFYRYSHGSLDILEEQIIRLGAGPLMIDRQAMADLLD